MDISTLVRDPAKVKETLTEIDNSEGNASLVTKSGCKVYFPKGWVEGGLGYIDNNFNVLCKFAIVVDDKYYSVTDALAIMTLTPSEVNTVKVEDADYYELVFEAGDTITPNLNLVKDANIAYEVYNEFISKGKNPFYMSYVETLAIFRTSKLHAGYNTGADYAVLSLMTASRARQGSDMSKYFRNSIKTGSDLDTKSPVILPLTSVANASNASSKIMGNRMNQGIISSLVNPTNEVESIEQALFS